MRLPAEFLMVPQIGAELMYSFVIIICSLMVYFGTRELYELSSHKGIKYFRQTFLFFAWAYFFRSIIIFALFLFDFREILDIPYGPLGIFTLFLFVYFSAMAVFSLLYSIKWKKWNGSSKKVYLFNLLAFIIASLSIISRSIVLRFGVNVLLFSIIVFTVYQVYREGKDRKKRNKLYAVYILLFLFFLLNVFDVLVPNFLNEFKMIIYLASITIFLLILYKVLKKIGS